MKRDVFINKVEKLGFEVQDGGSSDKPKLDVWYHHVLVATVDEDYSHQCQLANLHSTVHHKKRDALFSIVMQYASTPIQDREPTKRFVLLLPFAFTESGEKRVLKLRVKDETLFVGDTTESALVRCRFTAEEINTLKEKYNLSSFKVVPEEEV